MFGTSAFLSARPSCFRPVFTHMIASCGADLSKATSQRRSVPDVAAPRCGLPPLLLPGPPLTRENSWPIWRKSRAAKCPNIPSRAKSESAVRQSFEGFLARRLRASGPRVSNAMQSAQNIGKNPVASWVTPFAVAPIALIEIATVHAAHSSFIPALATTELATFTAFLWIGPRYLKLDITVYAGEFVKKNWMMLALMPLVLHLPLVTLMFEHSGMGFSIGT